MIMIIFISQGYHSQIQDLIFAVSLRKYFWICLLGGSVFQLLGSWSPINSRRILLYQLDKKSVLNSS